MRLTSGHASGILDKIVGLNKEIVGELFNRSELSKAGRLQQEKGSATLKALNSKTNPPGDTGSKADAKADDAAAGDATSSPPKPVTKAATRPRTKSAAPSDQ